MFDIFSFSFRAMLVELFFFNHLNDKQHSPCMCKNKKEAHDIIQSCWLSYIAAALRRSTLDKPNARLKIHAVS